ncbi:unnamed protein product [Danaus chrysippus]|uniref:(African queen) hypothetical protein n=1 Tax=Danaus chrysippus TaxID=151541 RepID=A0A8J2QI55_9NEOP|nr:unnamed protein product [Danaus chrysippus]
MKKAIEAVQNKNMGYKKAAKTFAVPRSTLRRLAKCTGESLDSVVHKPLGRNPFLIETIPNIILPLAPTLFAELIRYEITEIEKHVKKQLLVCSGEFSRNKILDALTFLRFNPFVFSIWRLFNVDITLPLTLFTVCTTYTIVLIQLKQLY